MTHYYSPPLTKREIQIITGTILGGSSIVKPKKGVNCYLSMRCKNGPWLDFKSSELAKLSSPRPITIEKTFRWHSLCYPIFNDFHKQFYKGKERKLSLNDLNPLTDLALAIWFGDAGSNKYGKLILNTSAWKEKGTKTIVEYLYYCGFNVFENKDRQGWRITFDEDSSKKYINMIGAHLPPKIVHQ